MTKDKNPKKTARREARQRRRVPRDACCIFCGESDPRVLEMHHVLGRAHEPDVTAPVCTNCHRKESDRQIREEVPLSGTDNLPDRLAAILGALAAFLRSLADLLDRLADQVKAFIGNLDARLPDWRTELGEGS